MRSLADSTRQPSMHLPLDAFTNHPDQKVGLGSNMRTTRAHQDLKPSAKRPKGGSQARQSPGLVGLKRVGGLVGLINLEDFDLNRTFNAVHICCPGYLGSWGRFSLKTCPVCWMAYPSHRFLR
jgi:hypothetical protein